MKKAGNRTAAQKRAARAFQHAGTVAAAKKFHKFGPTRAQRRAFRRFQAAGRRATARRLAGLRPLPRKRPKLSPGDVACCGAEAVAASLRIQGGHVLDEDVLELYWRVASGPDEGADIWELLRAARIHGLAGWYPEFSPSPGLRAGMILVYNLWDGQDAHAVTLHPEGQMITWGELWPLRYDADEAWAVRWHK